MKDLSNNKNSIASDLSDLAGLLTDHALIKDSKSLYAASEKVRTSAHEDKWGYECNNLLFTIDGAVAGSIPPNISYFDLIFNIKIQGIYIDEKKHFNPLNDLNFDLELHGLDSKPSYFYASWHLDKHIHEAGDNASSYSHPEYHLTFGGHKMEEKGDVFGECLILPTPRISYPPMDAVLGIDFILQNYVPLEKRKRLMVESKYREIVSNSQKRLWKPYYTSIASMWNAFPDTSFDANINYKKLMPFLDL